MPRLTSIQRHHALGLLEAGGHVGNIAIRFGVHRRTISRLQTRFNVTGLVDDRPRSGRPHVTSRRQDRYIVVTHARDRFLTASQTSRDVSANWNNQVSRFTVSRRLRSSGLRCRRPYQGCILSPIHRLRRREWANNHSRWTHNDWSQVLFTDESRFQLRSADGRQRVYRRTGERYADNCVHERDRFGAVNVMVWGGIHLDGSTALVDVDDFHGAGGLTSQRYIDHVLDPVVVPYLAENPPSILMQDNARPHTARLTRGFLDDHNIEVLPWPAISPDMNPIEHVWDYIGRQINSDTTITTRQQLRTAVHDAWDNMPPEYIRTLIRSMRRRIVALVNSMGGHTRY
jgi:transposase